MTMAAAFVDELRATIELAESLYEEETGRISGCKVSHPELFVRFGEAVGAPRPAMERGVPLPTTAALIDWFLASTRDRPFIEGAAATNLVAEGQVPGAFGSFARALEENVRRAVARSLELWWGFLDGIARVIDAR